MVTLAVLASGMVTALGFNAPATLAALRAGVSGVGEIPWTDFESGNRLQGAKVALPHWWEGVGKLADLVAPAIHECLSAAATESPSDIPLLIGVAAPNRYERTLRLDEDLLDQIEHRLGIPHHPQSRLFPLDEVGCAYALVAAHGLVAKNQANLVVVAGVDSFLHQASLNQYISNRRIITKSNFNGFYPGEAGAAILVGASGVHQQDELQILSYGFGQENATIESTEPFQAKGLTNAVKQALDSAGLSLREIAYRITDITGEHYKFKEALFVAGRLNSGERATTLDLWHPSEFLGAVGAAILPSLLAQAMHAGQHNYAPGLLSLCHIGNDDGVRSAMILKSNTH